MEAQQFSITTKLDGEAVFAIVGAGAGAPVKTNNAIGGHTIAGNSQNVTFGGRTRFNFRAKNLGVTGDELRIRLTATTDGGSFFGTSGFGRVGRVEYLGTGNTVTTGKVLQYF